jgi:hypothetical protein
MAKFSGTIRKSDLEGGHFQLECSDGSIYVLEGKASVVQGFVADQRVEIEGAIDRNVMSLAMTGPTLKVASVKKV